METLNESEDRGSARRGSEGKPIEDFVILSVILMVPKRMWSASIVDFVQKRLIVQSGRHLLSFLPSLSFFRFDSVSCTSLEAGHFEFTIIPSKPNTLISHSLLSYED